MIKLVDITKWSNNHRLNIVNLELPSTGLVIFLGEIFSGKTTLLNIIKGLERPISGRLILDGREIPLNKKKDLDNYRAQNIGIVSQTSLSYDLSVIDNLFLINDIVHEDFSKQITEVLDLFDLNDIKDKKCSNLSLFESQKLAIAISLVKQPKIIVVEDSTSSLNKQEQKAFIKILENISQNRLVLLGGENLTYEKINGRIINFSNGKIIDDKLLGLQKIEENGGITNTYKIGVAFRKAITLALGNIFKNFHKTILNSFVLLACLLCFFIAFIFSSQSFSDKLVNTIVNNKIDFIEFGKYSNDQNNPSIMDITNNDFAEFKNANKNLEVYLVYENQKSAFFNANGLTEIENKDLVFTYGSFPANSNEYFVTKEYAQRLLKHLQEDGSQINDISNLIGFNGFSTSWDFWDTVQPQTLVGIVETNLIEDLIYYKTNTISVKYQTVLNKIKRKLFVKIFNNNKEIKKLINKYALNYEKIKLNTQNYYVSSLIKNSVNQFYYEHTQFVVLLDLGYQMLFAIFFLLTISLNRKKAQKNKPVNELYINLGFSNSDAFKIDFFEKLLSLIVLVPATIGLTKLLLSGIEKTWYDHSYIFNNFFQINALSVIILIIGAICTILLVTLLSLIKYFVREPIANI